MPLDESHMRPLTWLAATLALASAGCLLPPPVEDKPLTAAVESEPRVDSTVGRDAPIRVAPEGVEPSSDVVSAPSPAPAGGAASPEDGVQLSQPIAAEPAVAEPTPSIEEASLRVEGGDGAPASEDLAEVPEEAAVERPSTAPLDGALEDVSEEVVAALEPDVSGELVRAEVDETIAAPEAEEDAQDEEPEVNLPGGWRKGVADTVDGLATSYRVRTPVEPSSAVGPPLVLVHGWCGRASQWDEVVAAFPSKYVVTIDLLGHGESRDQARAEWTIPRFGADVARVLAKEDLEDVVLIGHGMGGQVCLEVAARAPERVAGIVGVDCLQRLAGDPDPGRLEQYVATFRRDYEGQMRQFVAAAVGEGAASDVTDRVVREALEAPREMALALMEQFGVHDPRRAATLIECPVTCINSGSLATDVQGNLALLSSFQVEVLDGPGHWLHLEVPDRFAQALRGVVASFAPELTGARMLQSLSPVLLVDDPATVAAFYTEQLSFRLARRSPQDLAKPAAMIALERDGCRVVLQSLEAMKAELSGGALELRGGVLFLRVDSLEAERKDFGDDVRIVSPERELPSGSRQMIIADPEGNLVVLQQ